MLQLLRRATGLGRMQVRSFASTQTRLDELKTANKPTQSNIHHFKIYRWDPDQDQAVSLFFSHYYFYPLSYTTRPTPISTQHLTRSII